MSAPAAHDMHLEARTENRMRLAYNSMCLLSAAIPSDLKTLDGAVMRSDNLQGPESLSCACRGFQLGVWRIIAVGVKRKRLTGPSAAIHRIATVCHKDRSAALFPEVWGWAISGLTLALAKVS